MQDSIWLPSNWTTTSASEQKCSYVLGIDFGTSNSVVAIWRSDKGRVKIIKNSLEAKTTPSRITFHQDFDHYSIGRLASATATSTSHEISTRTIIGIKNLIGAESKTNFENRFSHLLEEIEDEENSNHVEIKKKVVVQCEDDQHHTRNYSPEELIALILSELRSNAIKYLQHIPMKDHGSEDVTALHRVVLGIPAHFTEKKKDCLRIAAQMAGFDEVHFLVESTAAAMAYGLLVAGKKYVLVFDMGGGTLDLTILLIEAGKHQVLYTGGHSQLGGQHFDFLLLKLIQDKFIKVLKKKGITSISMEQLETSLPCRNILMEESRQCKEKLSSLEEVDIFLWKEHVELMELDAEVLEKLSLSSSNEADSTTGSNQKQRQYLKLHIHRDEFLQQCTSLFSMIQETTYHVIQQCKQLHATSGEGGEDDFSIDEIVLVGGSSRIPQVQHQIRLACTKANITSFDIHSTREFCTSISPEYAVAEGLAIRGAILRGENSESLRHMLMLDCLPTTIGILSHNADGASDGSNNNGKYFEPILLQGSKLPVEVKKTFYLEKWNQRFVSLDIYEEIEEMQWLEDKQQVESRYKYQVLVTVDAPINKPFGYDEDLPTYSSQQQIREVEVIFKVDEEGQLSYDVVEVVPHNDATSSSSNPNHSNAILRSKKSSSASWTSSQQSKMLILYIFLLACVYISLKYIFPPEVAIKTDVSSIEEEEHLQHSIEGLVQQVMEANKTSGSAEL